MRLKVIATPVKVSERNLDLKRAEEREYMAISRWIASNIAKGLKVYVLVDDNNDLTSDIWELYAGKSEVEVEAYHQSKYGSDETYKFLPINSIADLDSAVI